LFLKWPAKDLFKNSTGSAQRIQRNREETPKKHSRRNTPMDTKASTYKPTPKQKEIRHTPCYTKTSGNKTQQPQPGDRNRGTAQTPRQSLPKT
jgi:hypothetical protein